MAKQNQDEDQALEEVQEFIDVKPRLAYVTQKSVIKKTRQ